MACGWSPCGPSTGGAEAPDSYQSNYITYDKCEGQIADTWEIADDYSSITVTIRDDVFFPGQVRGRAGGL